MKCLYGYVSAFSRISPEPHLTPFLFLYFQSYFLTLQRLFSNTSVFPSLQIDVLKVINYIDSDLVVQLKGRVACEMNSGEELISTECLFENQLDDLEPEEAVAIMSAFVFQQRNASEPSLTPKLAEAKKRLYFVFCSPILVPIMIHLKNLSCISSEDMFEAPFDLVFLSVLGFMTRQSH